tara:strand:- start:1077 stop:2642 length:1566 start_codon:yes stop_codon:yes gene_type:complete
MNTNKNIIIFYAVTNNHINIANELSNNLKKYEIVIVYESLYIDDIPRLTTLKSIKIDSDDLTNLNKFINRVSLVIFATAQLRFTPVLLYSFCIKNNLPSLTIQETHQMYLHNNKINNYLLPVSKFLINSKFEKKMFIKFNYPEKKLFVTGWLNPKNKYSNYKKLENNNYILLVLNASSQNNFISIESFKLQNELIKKIFNNFKFDHQVLVKVHPVDYTFYKKNNYFKNYKNLKIIHEDVDLNNLINYSKIIFLTGYTQIFFEAILKNKKIFILNYENKSQHIKNFKYLINKNDIVKNVLSQKYGFSFKDIYRLNNLELVDNLSKVNIINEIESLIKNPLDYMLDDYISLLIIIKFLKFNINCQLFMKNNYINNKTYDCMIDIYNNNENLESYYVVLKYLEKSTISFCFLKYLYLNYIIKNKKNNIEINHIFLKKDDPTFLYKYVVFDRERLINYVLLNNNMIKNSFKIINQMEKNNNFIYCNSFSIIFFRKIRSLLIKFNIKILNFIFFSLFEIYYKSSKK